MPEQRICSYKDKRGKGDSAVNHAKRYITGFPLNQSYLHILTCDRISGKSFRSVSFRAATGR